MNRIKFAFSGARETLATDSKAYEYKWMLPTSIFFTVVGYYLNNIAGDFMIIVGLLGTPLPFLLNGFYNFIIYLIVPRQSSIQTHE